MRRSLGKCLASKSQPRRRERREAERGRMVGEPGERLVWYSTAMDSSRER